MTEHSEGERVDRDRLLRDLGWIAEGNPRYAGTDEEDRQDQALARLMAEDLLLTYIDDAEVTGIVNGIRRAAPRATRRTTAGASGAPPPPGSL